MTSWVGLTGTRVQAGIMTKLQVEPECLALYYPRATPAAPAKLRVVAQVDCYDHVHALLLLRRVPNMRQLHTYIALDDASLDAEPLSVDVSHVMETLTAAHTAVGAVVSVLGFFDGRTVVAVECFVVDAQALLDGGADVVGEMASLRDL